MVVVLTGNGQEVDDAFVQGKQRFGETRKACGQITDAGSFKAGVVNEDRAALTAGSKQCFSKRLRRVFPGKVDKGLLFKLAGARQAMHAELKGNLLVGARAFPDRHGELDSLEIHEVGR